VYLHTLGGVVIYLVAISWYRQDKSPKYLRPRHHRIFLPDLKHTLIVRGYLAYGSLPIPEKLLSTQEPLQFCEMVAPVLISLAAQVMHQNVA
jgi:hypothetical protein